MTNDKISSSSLRANEVKLAPEGGEAIFLLKTRLLRHPRLRRGFLAMTILCICALSFVIFSCSNCYADIPSGDEFASWDIFNHISKMRGNFGVKSDKLLGENRLMFAGGSISDSTITADICVEDRKFLDDSVKLGADLQAFYLDDKRYKQITDKAGVYIYTRMNDETELGTEFTFSRPRIYNIRDTADDEIRKYKGANDVSTLLFTFENSPTDNDAYPKNGRVTTADFEVASKVLGSDFNFMRTTAQSAFYWTAENGIFGKEILKDITFVVNGQAGWITKFAGEEEIPFFERFYAGGTDTVRGYRFRYASPMDNEGLPIGGNSLLLFTAEMRYPLYKDFKGAIFYDQGNAWEKGSDMNLADMKSGVGTGVRWVTPLGTARLDYGYGLNHGTRAPGGRVHASLGINF